MIERLSSLLIADDFILVNKLVFSLETTASNQNEFLLGLA